MPIFRIMLERVDTITRQAVVTIEAETTDAALHRVLARLETDESCYDPKLVEVDSGFGKMRAMIKGDLLRSVGDIQDSHLANGKGEYGSHG